MKHIMLRAIFQYFLNAEFVCSVDSSLSGVGTIFGQGGGRARKQNISFIFPQNCQASASTKNVQ